MQTVIQHVMRGNGPPVVAPVEIGIHYIDVLTSDLYISRGKNQTSDWGEPLKAAMLEGEEGKTFGWNNGQDWIVLNVGVQSSNVDIKDNNVASVALGYADAAVAGMNLSSSGAVESGDVANALELSQYVDSQLVLVEGIPLGGENKTVLAKLSDADRDAHWSTVTEGEVLDVNVIASQNDISRNAIITIAGVTEVQRGGERSQILSTNWIDQQQPISRPVITHGLGDAQLAPPVLTINGSPFTTVYSEAERLYREFDVDGINHQVDSDSIDLTLTVGQHRIKCRDVTSFGVSEWSDDVVVTATSEFNQTEVTTSKDGENYTVFASFSTVNGVDQHVATDWVIKQNGVMVWSSLNDIVNLTSVVVPEGTLLEGVYDVEVRVKGTLYGWSAVAVGSFVVTVPFNGLAVPHNGSPYVTIYSQDVNTFTKVANPDVLPATTGTSCSFSPDGNFLAVTHYGSPFITIYSRSGKTFVKSMGPNILPPDTCNGCSFSPDGIFLVVTHQSVPYVTIYSRFGGTFTQVASPNGGLPNGGGRGCSFSPDGNFLAVAHSSSPFITIYSRNGSTFTKVSNPNVLPAGACTSCSFSSDGNFLAVSHVNAPFITIYSRSGSTFTKVSNPNVLPAGIGQGCSFSPDGNFLAVAHSSSPFITIYSRNGSTFTKVADPDVLPTYNNIGCSFSPDGKFLVTSSDRSPFMIIYSRSGNTFTKIANPNALPPNNVFYKPAWYYESLPVINSRAT